MPETRVPERRTSTRVALVGMVAASSLMLGSSASGLDATDEELHAARSGAASAPACPVLVSSSQVATLIPRAAAAGQHFGRALTQGDFDGDGVSDLVVGMPSYEGVGAVVVYRGGPSGYASGTVRDQRHASASHEAGDRFGEALAAGDVDRDGFSDLVVGAPGEDVGRVVDAGVVFVFRGSPAGLTTGSWMTQRQGGGADEAGDHFGQALAVGDLDRDGFRDLAVGAPDEAPGGDPRAGVVFTFPGSAGGVGTGRFVSQRSSGRTNDAGDDFGDSLLAADVSGDGTTDLVVGAPGDGSRSGSVHVFRGGPAGPGAPVVVTQGALGGTSEPDDRFGAALAAGDLDADGRTELVVGAPGEAPAGMPAGGVFFVAVLSGSSATGAWFSQVASADDAVETGDRAGAALATGDLDADGVVDLLVGAPGEDGGAGAAFVYPGSATGVRWGRGVVQSALSGAVEAGDAFGAAVLVADGEGDGSRELVVAAPGEAPGSGPASGIVQVAQGIVPALSLGPVVGGTTSSSARIWVRGTRAGQLRVQYRPRGASTWSDSPAVAFSASRDMTAVVRLDGLSAGTSYEIRAVVDCRTGTVATGRFRTQHATGSPSVVRFGFAADFARHRSFEAVNTAIAADADFNLLAGDLVYADQSWTATTLAQYESKYRENWGRPEMRRLLSRTSSAMMWDDHEISNDWSGGSSGVYPTARRAFDAYAASANPPPTRAGHLYYTFSSGQADFFVLDGRSHRDPAAEPDGPGKTMLGSAQESDLKAWLLSSRGTFKFLVSTVPWNDFATTGKDSWSPGYRTERDEILGFVREHGVRGVVLLSGDQHWAGAFELDGPGPSPFYEFMPTPIATDNRPAPGVSDPEILFRTDKHRVYGLFEVDTTTTPATLEVQFRDQTNAVIFRKVITERDVDR